MKIENTRQLESLMNWPLVEYLEHSLKLTQRYFQKNNSSNTHSHTRRTCSILPVFLSITAIPSPACIDECLTLNAEYTMINSENARPPNDWKEINEFIVASAHTYSHSNRTQAVSNGTLFICCVHAMIESHLSFNVHSTLGIHFRTIY